MQDGRDLWWHDLMAEADAECPCEPMDSEDLLYLLYTSGTTAKPKGIMHTTGGYLTQVAFTHKYVFDLHPDTDIYWCAADIGWVTGHSYIVYGPLTNGATSVIYEGVPDTPGRDRLWDIAERYGVTILYTAPTAIRTFMKWGAAGAREARPLEAPAARQRRRAHQPRGVDVVPRPHRRRSLPDRRHVVADRDRRHHDQPAARAPRSSSPARPRSRSRASRPRWSTRPATASSAAAATSRSPARGRRCCAGSTATPSGTSETYWSKYGDRYFAGDGCKLDDDGYLWLLGRVDDVMNVSGHRISTTEVESALVDHPAVAEAAVVGANDAVTGQAIMAYVIARGTHTPSDELGEEVRQHVAKKLGAIARPKTVIFTDELPKTRSGKIMRRLLRDVAEGRSLGDTTTLADPNVVEEIKRRAAEAPTED